MLWRDQLLMVHFWQIALNANFSSVMQLNEEGFHVHTWQDYKAKNRKNTLRKLNLNKMALLLQKLFHIRVSIEDSIKKWKNRHKLGYLGIPRYISCGLYTPLGQSLCRYLIIHTFTGDFEVVLTQRRISTASTVRVVSNISDELEYMHSRDYARVEIKPSNLIFETKFGQVYLLSFELVNLFRLDDVHCAEKPDLGYQQYG